MSTFVTLRHVRDYKKVSYYSVCSEDEEENWFQKFVNQYKQPTIAETTRRELAQIMTWIRKIGDRIGAKEQYFRHEGAANALPPPATYIEGNTGNLRLYCVRCSLNVVFLFSGGIKTAEKAQDCPNVAPHFALANRLTKAINDAFMSGDIRWNEYDDDILFEEDLEFEI